MFDLIWLILDHPRRVIVGLSLVGLDPIYSFGDMASHDFYMALQQCSATVLPFEEFRPSMSVCLSVFPSVCFSYTVF